MGSPIEVTVYRVFMAESRDGKLNWWRDFGTDYRTRKEASECKRKFAAAWPNHRYKVRAVKIWRTP